MEPADPQARLIALTFDLCEQANERAGYDAEVVNALRAAGVKATFFAGGKWLRTHPEQAMQLMADPLFEVGNHAWTHGNLRVLEGREARDQILWTQAEYQVLHRELAGRPCAQSAGPDAWRQVPAWPRVFRFPYGTCNPGSLDAAAGLGLAAIQWSLVTADPDKGRSAQAIARTVLDGVKRSRGTIVVAHANGRGVNTAKAPADVHPDLAGAGLPLRDRQRTPGGRSAGRLPGVLRGPPGRQSALRRAVRAGYRGMSGDPLEFVAVDALEPEEAHTIAATLAGIDPWLTLGTSAESLARGLQSTHPDVTRYLAVRNGVTQGLVGIRHPWLRGAYIELFAVLPSRPGPRGRAGGPGVHRADLPGPHGQPLAPGLRLQRPRPALL